MCGISGILHAQGDRVIERDVIASMCDVMSHRGPDDAGMFFARGVGLGHRRLSIIDIASGQQPMVSPCGRAAIVFNGEIYNHQDLRKDLEARGRRFRTDCDTEAVLNLYLEHGQDGIAQLRGMFAFAIWDIESQELLLVRDRVGIKPLYYAFNEQRLVFGSELKVVMASKMVDSAMDFQALDDFFAYGYIRAPRSIFRDVHKCEAGHQMVFKRQPSGRLTCVSKPYWTLPVRHSQQTLGYEEAKQELERLLLESVKIRLMSEVPLGAFLSGGIDSSTVVWLMSRASASKVKTFSIGFSEQEYSELPFARSVAKRFGTHHEEEIVSPDAIGILPTVLSMHGEPFGDPSSIPTWYVSQMARKYVTVVLSGDGGDEQFAGYARYITIARERARLQRLASWMRRGVSRLGRVIPVESRNWNQSQRISLDAAGGYAMFRTNFNPAMRERLFSAELLTSIQLSQTSRLHRNIDAHDNAEDHLSVPMAADFLTYLPDDVLTKVDRMSMAHSLETRVPLLDHHVVEFVQTLPASYLFRNGRTKNILRDVIEPHLPAEVLTHRKQGFSVPLTQWFRRELKNDLRDAIESPVYKSLGYFQPRYVKKLFDLHQSKRYDMSWQLWSLLIFCRWYEEQRGHMI
ncbi:MAG: asparagine synthase (glutamine-hydrolyzing) [Deltaproteobacteria bacterium]|nr:asparagine synthase (glutamine-hydrolyzing) [Deltaproteobacteria bacterium]